MDDPKNPVLNPTDPSGIIPPPADPPTPPPTDQPLVSDTPPASPFGGPPDAPLPPMPEPPSPFVPPVGEPGPPTPPAETPGADVPTTPPAGGEQPGETGPPAEETGLPSGETSGLPPVITPPSSGPKAKIIASIIGLVLLVVSIPAGIILVGRQQEIRERAAEACPTAQADAEWQRENNCVVNCATQAEKDRATEKRAAREAVLCPTAAAAPGATTTQTTSATVGWGSRCNGPACETGQGLTCRNDSQGLQTCLKASGSIGTLSECKDQTECGNNLTCRDGKCRINSGTQDCCGNSSQCTKDGKQYPCDTSNGTCESGFSCSFDKSPVTGTAAGAIKVGWGSACNGPTCEDSSLQCRADSKGSQRCLKASVSVSTLGDCKDQTECGANLTCRDGKCRLNSGVQSCCGSSSQCVQNGQQYPCDTSNGTCESGFSCSFSKSPVGAATTPPPTAAGACQVASIDVYEYPFTGAAVTNKDNKFKAGDLVRFVVKTSDDSKATKAEICEGSDCAVRSKATLAGGSMALYRDIRLGNVGSVTIKARCAF